MACKLKTLTAVVLLLAASLQTSRCLAEQIKLPVTKDNSIVMVDGEWQENGGSQGRIRIKGNQHVVAMGFDTSAIVGRLVTKATLICEQGEQTISGVSISTIATPWDETKSNGLSCGVEGIVDWGYPGCRFPAVCGGNGETLVVQCESNLKDGKYHWDVPPDMIHAMAIGVAHALAIHEHDADYGRNPTIFSKEQSGRQPYLLVELADESSPAVKAEGPLDRPLDLKVRPLDSQTAVLSFTPPLDGFAYEILVDGIPLGRHNIPLVEPLEKTITPAVNTPAAYQQTIFIRDLPKPFQMAGAHEVQIRTVNRLGKKSDVVTVKADLATPSTTPSSAQKTDIASRKSTTHDNDVAVIPVTDKYDQAGQAVGSLPDDYRQQNVLFDGSTIRLSAAAGEVIGFQTLLRGSGNVGITLTFEPSLRTELWQAVYVPANGRMIPDPLPPLSGQITLSADKDASIIADVFVPFDATPGIRKGALTISDGRTLPIELTILPFALPKHATFFCEMNGYGLPEHVDDYYKLQQVAYDHRVHSNILHYSHNTAAPGSRKSNMDMRLRSGRRMDNQRYNNITPGSKTAFWDDFAGAFGPVLDGSLFANGHRGPVPVPGFYLTFHESWPLHCREFFNGNPDAYEAFRDSPAYAETYVNILQDFVRLAKEKRWSQTGFQVYFNNKGSMKELTKAPWILDEPSGFWDYRALQFYGELTDRGRDGVPSVKIDYRVDISRPEYCRGQLDDRSDLWVVSSSAFQHYRRLVTDRIQRDHLKAWIYGTSNHVHDTNRNVMAWALDARRFGVTGIVPWQTVNKDGSALKEADQLGLFIFDKDDRGDVAVRHSLRLKAYRDVQQLIEYLNLLQKKQNWSDEQLRTFMEASVPLDVSVTQTHTEDAGTSSYASITPADLDALRQRAIDMLSQQ
jgi:hypothetical protein